ncbi:hypothetical protein NL466_29905, partial [Klebsiella pneumoniae]|nr:hypothetical protein [Klebsiella pneumoniae]
MSSESAPYDLLGSSFGKSFVVRKVAKSRLLWLNKRWFFEQGHDVTDVSVLAKLEAQILDGYAA